MIILTLLISFIAAAVDFFIEGKLTIVSRSYGLIVPLLILLPHIVYALSTSVRTFVSSRWLRLFDWYAFFIVAINIPGSIYFHKIGVQYDRVIHFGSAFFVFLILLLFILAVQVKIRKKFAKKVPTLLSASIILFAGLFLWELYQYSVDGIFGANLFYDAAQNIVVDFWEDIIYGTLGLFAASVYASTSFDSLVAHVMHQKH